MTGYSISESTPSPYLMGNAPSYANQYQQALDFHNNNYNQILGGYAQSQANIGQGFGGVSQGYGQLGQQVQGTIAGIGASQAQAIQDQYAKASGGQAQALINSGLGNTTVAASAQRGLTLDSQKAQIALANQMAQLQAGYQAQLGSAGLQAQSQGLGLQAQAANVQQGVLGGQRLPFPNYPPGGRSTTQQSGGSPVMGGGGSRGGVGGGTNGYWAQGGGVGQPLQTSFGGGMPNQFGYSSLSGQGGANYSGGGAGFVAGATDMAQGYAGLGAAGITADVGGGVVSDMGDYYGDLGDTGGGWFD